MKCAFFLFLLGSVNALYCHVGTDTESELKECPKLEGQKCYLVKYRNSIPWPRTTYTYFAHCLKHPGMEFGGCPDPEEHRECSEEKQVGTGKDAHFRKVCCCKLDMCAVP